MLDYLMYVTLEVELDTFCILTTLWNAILCFGLMCALCWLRCWSRCWIIIR